MLFRSAIQKIFLPALFEEPEASLTALRPLMCLGVGKADLGVPDPRDTVKANLLALQSITIFLVDSLATRTPLNTVAYLEGGSQDHMTEDDGTLERLITASSSLHEQLWMERATKL